MRHIVAIIGCPIIRYARANSAAFTVRAYMATHVHALAPAYVCTFVVVLARACNHTCVFLSVRARDCLRVRQQVSKYAVC